MISFLHHTQKKHTYNKTHSLNSEQHAKKLKYYCQQNQREQTSFSSTTKTISIRSSHQPYHFNLSDFGMRSGSQLLEFPCAFVFNSSERGRGVVTSPNYPGTYPRDTECNYFFYGSENERVHMNFNYFDVEGVLP